MPQVQHKQKVTAVPDANAQFGGERVRMSLEMAVDLVLCGILLAGLTTLTDHLHPDFSRTTLLTGLVGGGLCVVFGILGRRGVPTRLGAMITLAVATCVFAHQAVHSVLTGAESNGAMVTVSMTVLTVFCVGMLANLLRERKTPKREYPLA